jgi:hypothetical protein
MKVRRASDHGVSTTGFVIAVGRKWALLAETTDGGHPDGHIAVRLSDVAKVRWEETFQVRAEQLATTWPPEAPVPLDTLDLDSTRGVLRTLVGPAQLVSVETDRLRYASWIGVVYDVSRHWLWLWEVRPDGRWRDEPFGYRLGSLMTITVGSRYLRSLEAVAGDPPAAATEPHAS